MITNIELSHTQILALLADVAGVDPSDVSLNAIVNPAGEGPDFTVSATIATDFKGAQRVDRRLTKVAK